MNLTLGSLYSLMADTFKMAAIREFKQPERGIPNLYYIYLISI